MTASGGYVRISKETVVAALGWRKLLKPRKTALRIASNLTEIRTWYFLDTRRKLYRYTRGVGKNLLGAFAFLRSAY
jgi:hypothetical protein